LHIRQDRLQRIEHDRDLPAQKVGHSRGAAPVRHVLDIDGGSRLEHFTGQVAGRSRARGAVVQLARRALRERNEIGKDIDRLRRMHHDRHRRQRHQTDGREIPHRVVRKALVERLVDRVRADRRHQQRAAVGRSLRDGVGSQRATRAAPVVDDDDGFGGVAEHLRDRPRDDIGRTAGRKWDDEADLLAGERLCGGVFEGCDQANGEDNDAGYGDCGLRHEILPLDSLDEVTSYKAEYPGGSDPTAAVPWPA
jgi:hypothetical protein